MSRTSVTMGGRFRCGKSRCRRGWHARNSLAVGIAVTGQHSTEPIDLMLERSIWHAVGSMSDIAMFRQHWCCWCVYLTICQQVSAPLSEGKPEICNFMIGQPTLGSDRIREGDQSNDACQTATNKVDTDLL